MSVPHTFDILQAKAVNYLGAPIATTRSSFDFLIEKFSSKLNMWKSKVLSQAGRVVVIRSVLQSLPIYYMASSQIPKQVLNTITNLIRRFYWGALEKNRYMSYISWEKILMPKDMEGLAIRDLEMVNQALLMKALWKLASGGESQWIKLVKAKYIPNSKLWLSKRTYRCSNFWRGIMNLRGKLRSMIQWQLGDGSEISVFGEPWFPNALDCIPQNQSQKSLKVNQLMLESGQSWDIEKIILTLGNQACVQIISNCDLPTQQAGPDRLIFTHSKNGEFSVKHAYNSLRQEAMEQRGNNQVPEAIWKVLWKKGVVIPRIRLFIWKLLQNGLPLAQVLSKRISRGDPTCQTCKQSEEDSLHLIFRCPFAKACWYGSPLALRTDELAGMSSIKEALFRLAEIIQDDSWGIVACIIWSIWRCRNDKAYAGKEPTFSQFQNYLATVMLELKLHEGGCAKAVSGMQQGEIEETVQTPEFHCQVDGSWVGNWEGGIGFILWEGSNLLAAKSKGVHACAPIHAEAIAISQAVQYAKERGISECLFKTDSKVIADSIMGSQPPLHVDWRAFREVFQVWEWFKKNRGYRCKFTPRAQNELTDRLAKRGTREKWDFVTFTFPILLFEDEPNNSRD